MADAGLNPLGLTPDWSAPWFAPVAAMGQTVVQAMARGDALPSALGVQGSGIASALAFALSFFAMLGVVLMSPAFRKYHLLHRFTRPDWAKFKEVFRLGGPIGMGMVFEAMLFNSATLIMGTFGAASVAAHQIALNIASVTFMVPLGLSLAATVRVGLFAGARNAEGVRRAGHTAIIIGGGFMLLCAIMIALFPKALVGV